MSLQVDICHINTHFSLKLKCQFPATGISGIFGHSGTGKTTLLRCIAGLEPAASGSINFHDQQWLTKSNGATLAEHRKVGMVFQDSRLFPHLSVEKNLLLAQQQVKNPSVSIAKLCDDFSITALLNKSANQLSAGQQQRVAIVRSLLAQPQLLLLDEPLSALDHQAKKQLMAALKEFSAQHSLPMLYVSHSPTELAYLCDQLLIIKEGVMVDFGNAKELLTAQGLLGHQGKIVNINHASNQVTIELSAIDCSNLTNCDRVYLINKN